jgi:hypothetical protein
LARYGSLRFRSGILSRLPGAYCATGSKPMARLPPDGPPYLLLCRLALLFLSASRGFFRGGDPSRTELRNPADELHRYRFGEWEMDRPLSQLIAPELTFERREERPRCGKQ